MLSFIILSVILMQWLRSYRWGVILQPMEKINQFSLFSITSVGFLAIASIPARIGELARPYLISKRSSIKMSSALGTILVERVLDSFTVLAIAVIILFFIDLPPLMIISSIIFFLLALAMFCFILFLILRRDAALKLINKILSKLPGKFAHKIDELIHHFIDGFQIVTNIKFYYLRRGAQRRRAQGGRAQTQVRRSAAHVHAAAEAQERARRGPLRHPVRMARRPFERDLFVGVSAARVPVPGVQLCGGGDDGDAELAICALPPFVQRTREGWGTLTWLLDSRVGRPPPLSP